MDESIPTRMEEFSGQIDLRTEKHDKIHFVMESSCCWRRLKIRHQSLGKKEKHAMATIYEESELTLPMLIGSNNRSLVRCLTESRAIAYQLVRSSRERDSPTRDVQTRSFSVEKCSDTDKERERKTNDQVLEMLN